METFRLISMTDFVLEQRMTSEEVNASSFQQIQNHIATYYDKVYAYANFLKQSLTLGMFVPLDKQGNLLKGKPLSPAPDSEWIRWENEEFEFYKAKERVLFKGFSIREEKRKKFVGVEGYEIEVSLLPKIKMTIEDLASDWNHIELTESAIKQIGLNP